MFNSRPSNILRYIGITSQANEISAKLLMLITDCTEEDANFGIRIKKI